MDELPPALAACARDRELLTAAAPPADSSSVVLDTNIVLDLFLFDDPRTHGLRKALQAGHARWVATAHMREELSRVLQYPHVQALMHVRRASALEVLAGFDRFATLRDSQPLKAPYTCKDIDDQPFIDLACAVASDPDATTTYLISKDKAVLCMRRRLAKLSVFVEATYLG